MDYLDQVGVWIDDFDEHSLEQLVAIEGKIVHEPGDAGRPDAAAEMAQQHCHLAPAESGRLACAGPGQS